MNITILCYGDSNTWGPDLANGGRLPRSERWPGILEKELGDGYAVIEEGLSGRLRRMMTRWSLAATA